MTNQIIRPVYKQPYDCFRVTKSSNSLFTILLIFLLAGCAAQQAYRDGVRQFDEGKVEEGLAQMDKAYKLDPDKSEYRTQYFKRREMVVFKWLSQADDAKNKGAWEDAEKFYQRVLRVDEENPRAKIGLSSLKQEKKQSQILEAAKDELEKGDFSGAFKNVRTVLEESPSHPLALKLKKSIELKATLINQTEIVLKSKLTRPITIEFKDAPIHAVFDSISKVSGINFIFDKEVRPDLRTNLFVRDARIEDVMRFVLFTNQLEQHVLSENTVFIYPKTPQKLKDMQELDVRNFYITNARAKDVAAMLKGMLKPKDIYVDDKLNLIVMRDTPDIILVADRLIAGMDIAEPEVMMEVEVLEVDSNLLDTIGIQYPSQISFSVEGAAGTAGTATLAELQNHNSGMVQVTLSNPAFVINMLHQDGSTDLLANPKIRAKNHEKANIHIGDKVPVITNTTTSTGLVSQSVNYLDVGLKLDVEPTVFLDNDVEIKVGLEVSNIVQQIQEASGARYYQIGTRTANTALRLKDGETQILAGLINKEDQKTASSIPGLGQLPVLGRLFSNKSDTGTKSEIVLLITPRVVRNIVRPESPIEKFPSGTESIIGLERLEINRSDSVKDKIAEVAEHPSALQSNMVVKSVETISPPQLGKVELALDSPSQVQSGKEFTVRINMTAEGLQNALLNMSFDSEKLKVVKVIEGDFLKRVDNKTQFLQQVQDNSGRISLSLIREGNVQGEGMLASVTFQVLPASTGSAQVRIAATNFSDASGKVLPVNTLPMATIEIVK